MPKKRIYFLCTGNSCRSQMADAWAHQYLNEDEWDIRSAGIEAHGLNPLAVKAMAEVGIDITNYTSNIIDINYLNRADLVITLCGDANDRCPMTPPNVKRVHWGFPDPAKALGTPVEKWRVFQNVRDGIGKKVQAFAADGRLN